MPIAPLTEKRERVGMEKRIKWCIACILLAESGVLSFRFYQDLQRARNLPLAALPATELPATTNDLQAEDQAFTQMVLELVSRYYVHANQLPYGLWMQESLRLLQEGQQGVVYTPASSTLSFGGHSLVMAVPTTLETLAVEARAISEFLNQTKFLSHQKTAKDLSPGCVHMLEALMQALDPHSVLMAQESYADLRQTTEGKFGGLGLLLHMEKDLLSIGRVIPHSPAHRHGLTSHDRIISIDGVPTYGKSLDEVTLLLRGDAGSSVRLSVVQPTDWGPREVVVRREVIQVPSVEARDRSTAQGRFLQLKIFSFSQHTTQEVIAALHQATKKQALDGLILDLRENPGGLLDEAIHLASLFLPKGVVVRMRGQTEEAQSVVPVQEKWTVPIVALMNENSASASEILAGALKDHHRAVVVGTRSYGKASVQTVFELPYAYALKLTIARYYTPNGTLIQDKGIIPDIWLQPVLERAENRDLLGDDRYRQEKFLVNSTNQVEMSQAAPQWMGYYVQHPHGQDRTMQVALLLLGKGHPFVSLHHSREIPTKLAAWSQEVQDYLNTRHHIQWTRSAPVSVLPQEDLSSITVDVALGNGILHPHQLATATYEVRNGGAAPLHAVSLLFSNPEWLNAPVETLIGTLPPAGVVRGVLTLRPTEAGISPLTVQVAQGGILQEMPVRTLSPEVRAYPAVSVHAEVGFSAENSLSNVEANGSGRVWVRIVNAGKMPLHHLVATLRNLGGKQLEVLQSRQEVDTVAAGETKVLEFAVQGAQRILSSHIEMGVQLEGEELPQAMRQSISLSATPACQLSARRIP